MAAQYPPHVGRVNAFLSCSLASRCFTAFVGPRPEVVSVNTLAKMELTKANHEVMATGASAPAAPVTAANGSLVMMMAPPLPLRPRPEGVVLKQSVEKSHEKSHDYVKKVISVDKYPKEKKKGKYVELTVKYKDGEWVLKQHSHKLKI